MLSSSDKLSSYSPDNYPRAVLDDLREGWPEGVPPSFVFTSTEMLK